MKNKLIFHKLPHAAKTPRQTRDGDAGYDLAATKTKVLPKRKTIMINTGWIVEIPEGYVGLLIIRSGLGVKHDIKLANGTGVIDSNYRGEIKAALINTGDKDYLVTRGDRVVQLVVTPIYNGEVIFYDNHDNVTKTNRGSAGFGSSGNK